MAETINSFDTAQGRFDTVKYDAPVHIYSVDEAGKKVDIGEDKMLEAFPYKGPQEPPPAEPILEVASSEPTRIEVRAEDEPAVATETAETENPTSALEQEVAQLRTELGNLAAQMQEIGEQLSRLTDRSSVETPAEDVISPQAAEEAEPYVVEPQTPATAEFGEREPREVTLRGTDHNGNRYLLWVMTDGSPVRVNRNVDENWGAVGDGTGWFEVADGSIDLLNPPEAPSDASGANEATAEYTPSSVPQPTEVVADERERRRGALGRLGDAMRRARNRVFQPLVNLQTKGARRTEQTPDERLALIRESQAAEQGSSENNNDANTQIMPTAMPGNASSPESGERRLTEREVRERRRGGMALVIGGGLVALAGVGLGWYLRGKGMDDGGLSDNIPGLGGENGGGNQGGDSGLGNEILQGAHGESLSHVGDTIWYHVEDQLAQDLGRVPSDNEVWKATQKVLQLNKDSLLHTGGDDSNNLWEAARHLPVGWKFRMPENLAG